MARPRKYDREANEKEGLRIDRAIAGAKAVICIRRFRSLHEIFKNDPWLSLAERHIAAVNGYLREVDRVSTAIDDDMAYVGGERRESRYG